MIQTEDWLMNLSTEIDLNPLKLSRVYTATVQKTFFAVTILYFWLQEELNCHYSSEKRV